MADRPETLTECNCSICRRYGALWAYCTSGTATVTADPGKLKPYVWGDRSIAFCHCTDCGCLTHYESVDKTGDYRIAVNARMLPPYEVADVEIKLFDGADSWKYIER